MNHKIIDTFTDEQLDFVALCVIQAVHVYSYQGQTIAESSFNANAAIAELLKEARSPYQGSFYKITSRIERVGRANGYFHVDENGEVDGEE